MLFLASKARFFSLLNRFRSLFYSLCESILAMGSMLSNPTYSNDDTWTLTKSLTTSPKSRCRHDCMISQVDFSIQIKFRSLRVRRICETGSVWTLILVRTVIYLLQRVLSVYGDSEWSTIK